MRIHDLQTYRKVDVTRQRISLDGKKKEAQTAKKKNKKKQQGSNAALHKIYEMLSLFLLKRSVFRENLNEQINVEYVTV